MDMYFNSPITKIEQGRQLEQRTPNRIITALLFPNLFNTFFFVNVPVCTVCGQVNFVSGGPLILFLVSLCGHGTNIKHCTQINLKIVCSVRVSLCTSRSVPPVFMESAIVWIIVGFVKTARCHSSIWYSVPVRHTN